MDGAHRTTTVTAPSDRVIHVERVFDAPRECVWRVTTEPDLVAQWWGRGHAVEIERLEVTPGGHWRFVEHTPDGPDEGFEGRYREVVAPSRAVQTWEWDGMPGSVSLQTAAFEDLGDGHTKLTIDALFFTTEERDGMLGSGMKAGVDASYETLDRLLARIC